MGSDDPVNPYAPPKTLADGEPAPPPEDVPEMPEVADGSAWTTVSVYGTDAQAVEALKLLERARIECRVLSDGTTGSSVALHWIRSMPLGGHLVQVRSSELVHASKVLGVSLDPDDLVRHRVHVPDERMKKSLLLAALGAFVCPGPAQLVSMVLVLATPGSTLTALGRRWRLWAVAIDLAVFAILAFVLLTEPTTPAGGGAPRLPPLR